MKRNFLFIGSTQSHKHENIYAWYIKIYFLCFRSEIISEFTHGRMAPTYRYLALVFEDPDSYIGKLVSTSYFDFNSNDFTLFTIL